MEVCGAGNVGRVELENNLLQIQRARKKNNKMEDKEAERNKPHIKKACRLFCSKFRNPLLDTRCD